MQQSALSKHSPQSLTPAISVRSRPQSAHLLVRISVTKIKIIKFGYINLVKLPQGIYFAQNRTVPVTENLNVTSYTLARNR